MKWFRFVLVLFLGFSFCSMTFADNTFSFSTEPQSVGVGVLSGPMTVHSETQVTETTYILLSSTSATGQFFSSKTSTEPIQASAYIYISTNNSNRTFYYKDSTVGDFVVTANVYNKEKTSQIGGASQHIVVGGSSSAGTEATPEESETSSSSSSTSQSSNTSAHSSPAPLSGVENKIEFEVSAGRERLTTVGNSLDFRASLVDSKNVTESSISYLWSFGDGTSGQGSSVSHTYKFPGEYSVVLNANYSDKQSVGRTKVKVISPDLKMQKITGGVEITNNSKSEINLEKWNLISAKRTFVFPADTLISAGGKITFADDITGISEDSLELLNPLNKQIASIAKVESKAIVVRDDNLKDIQEKIEEVQKAVSQIKNENPHLAVVEQKPLPASVEPVIPQVDVTLSTENASDNTAIVFEGEKKTGVISKMFAWPISGINFIKRLFVEE